MAGAAIRLLIVVTAVSQDAAMVLSHPSRRLLRLLRPLQARLHRETTAGAVRTLADPRAMPKELTEDVVLPMDVSSIYCREEIVLMY
jgi:hypothetical protein